MLNPLKTLRYLVFVMFLISNAIIASVAVWNLSLNVVAREISTYLIVLGAVGLVFIFTVIFSDLFGKDLLISRVWFELLWVILFFVMELAGATTLTARKGQVCNLNSSVMSCVPTQVLQAFTWICAICLLAYFILLLVSATLKYKDDATIWNCSVRKIIWQQTKTTAFLPPLPRFHTQVPVIAAPGPQRIVTIPEAVLSYRSGLSLSYEIEHYQPPAPDATDLGPSADAPLSPLLLQPLSMPVSPPRILQQQPQQSSSAAFTPFYPSYLQTAINPALSPQVRRPPQALSPSPPPLGDWPRHDVTSLPARGKRKQTLPAPYSFTMPTAVQQRHDQPTRSRPGGPRRRPNDHGPPIDDHT